ncbi:hypothetical protein C8R44DRAFT_750827 [Mycena epipterygia]|nr:hypothetical protein C8R44DRAFT_750827 [Mycena epipterygia]
MSHPHGYYNQSGSSKNYPKSSYSSLADAGMSNPTANQSMPPGYYAGAMQPGQMYPHTSSGRGHPPAHPSSQAYQQSYGAPAYGMGPGPPLSPDSPLNYNNNYANPGAGYPSTPYNSGSRQQYPGANSNQWAGAQPPHPGSSYDTYMAAVEGAPQSGGNYPYPYAQGPGPGPGPGAYPHTQYAPPSANDSGIKECYHCHATTTPLWRRDPVSHRVLCNACGLYLQQRHAHRPQELIDADNDDPDASDGSEGAPDGPECSHCHTRQTSVWRRNKDGEQVCNACGVYWRLRGKERPLELKRNKIKPRAKHPQT